VESDLGFRGLGRRVEQGEEFFDDVLDNEIVFGEFLA
jgi:hypothetical protein